MTNRVDDWFTTEVLPYERALIHYVQKHVSSVAEAHDIRQEVYVRIYEAAVSADALPNNAWAMSLRIARNLLIDRSRRARVVSLELLNDQELEDGSVDALTPERYAAGREELRRFEQGLLRLPARCREVIRLRKVDGVSQRECAARMGISEDTVARQSQQGLRALADFMSGGEGRIVHQTSRRLKVRK